MLGFIIKYIRKLRIKFFIILKFFYLIEFDLFKRMIMFFFDEYLFEEKILEVFKKYL